MDWRSEYVTAVSSAAGYIFDSAWHLDNWRDSAKRLEACLASDADGDSRRAMELALASVRARVVVVERGWPDTPNAKALVDLDTALSHKRLTDARRSFAKVIVGLPVTDELLGRAFWIYEAMPTEALSAIERASASPEEALLLTAVRAHAEQVTFELEAARRAVKPV